MAEKEKDELEKMNEALSMSEQFVEKYQKPLLLGLLVVVVIVGAILGVRHSTNTVRRLPVIWQMPLWDWLIMKKGSTKRHRNIFLHSVRTRPCCLLP